MAAPQVFSPLMEDTTAFHMEEEMTERSCSVDGCNSPTRSRGRCLIHYSEGLSESERLERIEVAGERFWRKVDKSGDCWEWTGAKYPNGYGAFRGPDGRVTGAHRYAFAEATGPIDADADIDHLCGNTSCVRPAHLRSASRKQNIEHRVSTNRNNKSGYSGVYLSKGLWWVKVRHNYKAHYRGGFRTAEEANEVAIALRNELFTFNDRDQTPQTPAL